MLTTVLIIISVCLLLGLIYLWRENTRLNTEIDSLEYDTIYKKDLMVYPITVKHTIPSGLGNSIPRSELYNILANEFKSSITNFMTVDSYTLDNGHTWEYTAVINIADPNYNFTAISMPKNKEKQKRRK